MNSKVAKELLHIQSWLSIASVIVAQGHDHYVVDNVAQEAGDSLLIKLGEAAKRLAAHGVEAPKDVDWSDAAKTREKIAHHYSVIDREMTWMTLSVSLPQWQDALAPLFDEASAALGLAEGKRKRTE